MMSRIQAFRAFAVPYVVAFGHKTSKKQYSSTTNFVISSDEHCTMTSSSPLDFFISDLVRSGAEVAGLVVVVDNARLPPSRSDRKSCRSISKPNRWDSNSCDSISAVRSGSPRSNSRWTSDECEQMLKAPSRASMSLDRALELTLDTQLDVDETQGLAALPARLRVLPYEVYQSDSDDDLDLGVNLEEYGLGSFPSQHISPDDVAGRSPRKHNKTIRRPRHNPVGTRTA